MRNKCVNGGPGVAERRFCSLQTQRNVPAPSLLELQSKRRETTELGYPGRCPRQPPETHARFRSTRSKELGLWPGTRVFVGRPGSVTAPVKYVLPRFHTPGRRPARARFFLPFGSFTIGTAVSNLKPGCWDLGPGSVGTRDSGSKAVKSV
jgi:hypothetical protein